MNAIVGGFAMSVVLPFGDEDVELDRLWREQFGEPLPIRGCGDVAWQLLEDAASGARPRPAAEARSFAR